MNLSPPSLPHGYGAAIVPRAVPFSGVEWDCRDGGGGSYPPPIPSRCSFAAWFLWHRGGWGEGEGAWCAGTMPPLFLPPPYVDLGPFIIKPHLFQHGGRRCWQRDSNPDPRGGRRAGRQRKGRGQSAEGGVVNARGGRGRQTVGVVSRKWAGLRRHEAARGRSGSDPEAEGGSWRGTPAGQQCGGGGLTRGGNGRIRCGRGGWALLSRVPPPTGALRGPPLGRRRPPRLPAPPPAVGGAGAPQFSLGAGGAEPTGAF